MTPTDAALDDEASDAASRAATREDQPTRLMRWAVLTGVLCAASTGYMLREGIALTPDGWDYWEASASIVHGHGYTRFNGATLRAFPPLFSSYLAAVQWVFGTTGASLIAAIVVLAGATGACWMALYQRLASRRDASPWISGALAIFLAAYIGLHFRHLLSETLFLLLLAVCLLLLLRLHGSESPDRAGLAWLGLATTALLLTRNSGVVFLPGIAWVVYLRLRGCDTIVRWLCAFASAAIPLAIWQVTRSALSLGQAHQLSFRGKWTPAEYLGQIPDGVARLLGASGRQDEPLWNALRGLAPPDVGFGWALLLGLAAALIWLARPSRDAVDTDSRNDSAQVLAVGAIGLAGLYAVFNATFVGDPLMGRFLWFVPPLLVVSVAGRLSASSGVARMRVGIALLALAAILQGVRYNAIRHHLEPNVRPHHATAPMYKGSSPTEREGLTFVSPPRYLGKEGRVRPFKPKTL